jgi:hypothetical protein
MNTEKGAIDNRWTFGRFPRRVHFLQNLYISQMIKSFYAYQPIELNGKVVKKGDRECADRWTLIEAAMRDSNCKSLMDLGCAEGYFVRQAATRLNCVSIGVDGDLRRVTLAQNLVNQEGLENASFMFGMLSSALVEKLPATDAVIFCSVLHHVMREKGLDEAVSIMRAVRACTKRLLIFDMGQSNEVQYPWAAELPQMSPNPKDWISAYLADFGFCDVRVIGETPGYLGAYPRLLFAANVPSA